MNTLYHDTALGFGPHMLALAFGNRRQYLFIGNGLLMILVIQLQHLVDNLSFFQAAVPYRRAYGFPVFKTVFFHNAVHILRLHDFLYIDGLCFAVGSYHLFSFYDVIFLPLISEPLVNLILRLRAFYHIQPVQTRSFGILRSQDFYTVAIFDNIINRRQFAVHSGANHFISYCAVDIVGKINRRRNGGKVFHFAPRGKTIYAVRK